MQVNNAKGKDVNKELHNEIDELNEHQTTQFITVLVEEELNAVERWNIIGGK